MKALSFPSAYAPGQKPYDIFKDRVTAINSITVGIKGLITNRYYKQLNEEMIKGLGKKISADQEAEKLGFYKGEPDPSIYPSKEVMENTVGQFVDYSMGAMRKKETMMGGLPAPTARTGVPSGVIPTGEVMMPGMDKQQLLDHVMAGGEMDWSSILKVMEKRPGFLGEYSPLEQTAIESVMGRDVMGEKIEGIERASMISDFFAKPEKKRITNMYEYATEDPEGYREFLKLQNEMKITTTEQNTQMWVGMYNRKEITRDELMKLMGGYVTPAKLSDWEKKWNMFIKVYEDNNMEIPFDNALKILGAYVTPVKPGGELKDLIGSDINTYNKMFYGDDKDFGAITPEEYAEAKDSWGRMNKNKPVPEHLSILERSLQDCLTTDNKIVDDEWFKIYEWIYPYYEDVLKGKSPKYLPPGEIKKIGAIEGALTTGGVKKGDYGSALAEDKEGKEKDESGYIVGETYRDEEGTLFKYLGNGRFEEVEEKPGERSRKGQ